VDNRIKEIAIVGGGTAGWLTAVYLDRALNRAPGKTCTITLIESREIGIIGVGESTIPSMRPLFQLLGFEEDDWMRACNATFKLGVKYVHWSGLTARDVYWHTFPPLLTPGSDYDVFNYWLRRRAQGDEDPFALTCLPSTLFAMAGKSPRRGDEPPYEGGVTYAYHLDARLLASYLKNVGTGRGVRHVVDTVRHVSLDERGFIAGLHTAEHGTVTADLYVDCSGFAGLLINQALHEQFESYGDCLFCDRAIALPVPTDDAREGVNPYTTATAGNAGWFFHVPLMGRSGNGYVYASGFLSPDEAERELRARIGPRADGLPARHLTMRIGKNRCSWVKNCVSIGLASGFVEPMEATALLLIDIAASLLVSYFPDKTYPPRLIEEFNKTINKMYEDIRDFIVLHYCISHREDTPFWRTNKHHPAVPDSLKARLELWQEMLLPNFELQRIPSAFVDYSWFCTMVGMHVYPERVMPIFDHLDDSALEVSLAGMRQAAESLRGYPDHAEYLRRLHLRQ
jgi:tryptophan halogenase